MEFNKFKQMATDYENFMNHIAEVSKDYCLLKDIKFNPMDGYWHGDDWYQDGNLVFEFNEHAIIIKDAHDVGRCGETKWEPYQLSIPMDFFNPNNRDNQVLEIKKTQEEIENLEKDLRSASNKLGVLKSEEMEIRDDKWKLEGMSKQYKQNFDAQPFIDKTNQINDKIRMQEVIVGNLQSQIKKLKA